MKRFNLTILLLPMFLLATAAFAQDSFTGRFTFSQFPGSAALMVLELGETGDGIIGIGQTTPDLTGIGAAVVTVLGGAAFEANLQLDLEIEPFDSVQPTILARFQVIDGSDPVASLIYAGQTISGIFVGQTTGVVPLGEPRPLPTPTSPPPANATCIEMQGLTEQLNLTASSAIIQVIRGIYTNAGLAFGGEQTPGRCAQALRQLQNLAVELEEGRQGEGPNSCTDLDGVLSSVFIEFDRLEIRENGELDGILANAGLQIGDLNPNGVWNEATCARAIPGVEGFLARIRIIPTGGAAASPGGTQSEAMIVLPVRGFAPADGGNNVELWGHNGSQMAVETSFGGYAAIWYWAPRAGLLDVGVRQGTLLFSGEQIGTSIDGQARLFTADCGVFPYAVGGPWFDGASQITMTGLRPLVDAQCRVIGTEPETLVFGFIAFEPSPAEQPTQTAPQQQPQSGAQSNGIILVPLGAATISNSDLLRPLPQPQPQNQPATDPDDDFGEPTPGDVPGFGVWAEVYEVYDVSDTLNMRAGPGTGYGVVAELPRFARNILVMQGGCSPDLDQISFSQMGAARQAQVLSTRWCNIEWNGRAGWVYGRYIRPY